MLASLGILIIAATIIVMEYPALSKSGSKQEAVAFGTLLTLGTVLGIALAFHVKVPSPLDMVSAIYKPITSLISTFLKG
ncbi:hypothetical protein C7Y44_00445 [Paenibacillus popilliae]|uniref:Uncharacterized protein n=1 Tax=Paenibacillus popilliae TaxID=78057 RepID=A0ABY3AWS8_PAEPP|nr:hypothetical protein C7Y44_00445 [Paenibacillus sp. SDF0028]